MRFLILSDSHGNVYNIRQVLLKHQGIENIIFLGDGVKDFENLGADLNGRKVTMVCGNCDFGCELPAVETLIAEEKKIYITHGHKFSVKYGTDSLLAQAYKERANLVLFGHTHNQYIDYIEGMHVVNPGSINEGFYAVADVTKQGIVISAMDIR